MKRRSEHLCGEVFNVLQDGPRVCSVCELPRGQVKGRIQVISKDALISSKRAAGREIDPEYVRLLELPDIGGDE